MHEQDRNCPQVARNMHALSDICEPYLSVVVGVSLKWGANCVLIGRGIWEYAPKSKFFEE